MNSYRKWPIKFFVSFCLLLLLFGFPIIAFNYVVDPLWIFQHENKWNDVQQGFNERQQKVNKFTFSDKKYDALLLGSSRSTYINQHDFEGLDVFNFAVSSMYVEEYKGYIDYAKKVNGKSFDYIFLGLDFFAANKNRKLSSEKPEFYIDQTNSYMYRARSAASFDTLKKAWPIFLSSKENKPVFIDHRYYDRQNVAFPFPVTDDLRQKRIETNIYEFFKNDERFEYDPNIKKMLEEIVRTNPGTKFIVFTTPVTMPRFVVELQNEEYWKGYEQWLSDLTDVFGTIHHFMDINEVTVNYKNFTDSHHFVPEIGSKIVDHIWNKRKYAESQDPFAFGKLVTADNKDEIFARIKNDITVYSDAAYNYLEPVSGEKPFYAKEGSRAASFASSDWKEQVAPLRLLGAKGDFEVASNGDHVVKISPASTNPGSIIQFGYHLSELTGHNIGKDKVTFIVSLKGNAARNGDVQLFIQDRVNGKWERASFNTILDKKQARSFKISKKIRDGADSVLIGIRWQNQKSSDQWIEIENVKIF
ncbi:hypothetical protein C0966_12615 [Bacillus methanolicus]|uniref:hypothetical protein n=1 Tax=Bacillus methanolicus TaxID=1471 RepID=UPI0023800A1E|nr:hypothetical protein [Bacillus methanolicus]MDE3840189.1 hypothetical protein [Bacillus methanolicus]